MKTIKIFTALVTLLFTLSCSKSLNEEEIKDQEVAFEGVWELRDITDINLDGNTVPVELSQDIIGFLEVIINEGCELMSFEFKPDKSLILEQYNVTDYNPTVEEVEYVADCSKIDIFTGTWDLQDDQLIITNSEDETVSITIKFESGSMILEDLPLATILPIDGDANFIFEKLGNG
ncbi:hypothetical protein PW52_10760 [Tamlana sedimentorum]|uniref:Lipocalin-like domain-containing protein n=1 Tax=Neotamlana sedimentorum TaxID=1435349 RepID=A0A0D7WBN0_9FLAO|nr:hypothetical protein [Tamlana sedimentorum]KJD35157.1 hypothetical protein PW52_10760 [Tamlana sedimentorum]